MILDTRDDFMESAAEQRVKKLKTCLEWIEKLTEEEKDIVTGWLYDALNWSEWNIDLDLDNYDALVRILIEDFYNMSKLSKRKIALFWVQRLFKNEYEELTDLEKQKISERDYVKEKVKLLHVYLSKITYWVASNLYDNYKMKLEFMRFYEAYIGDISKDWLLEKMDDDYISDWDVLGIWEDFPSSWLDNRALRRVFQTEWRKETKFSSMLEWFEKDDDNTVDINNFNHIKVEANGFINPNWFLYDIGVIDWIKLFWEDKTRYLFGKYFWNAIKNINSGCELKAQLPWFYNLFWFRLKKDAWNASSWPANEKSWPDQFIDMYQHIIEWDLPKDWDEKWLEEIGVFMKDLITDLNLSIGWFQEFRHPVKTMDWRVVYRWYFSWVKDFENQHIVCLKNKDNGQKKLRFASECGQDAFMYFITQISYYLEHNKFLNKNQLFSMIYRNYNLLTTENQEVFDISMFKEQYEALIENVIWPHSIEYINKHWKPWKAKNTLLVWIYGTGKSQFLLNMLKKKKFDLNGKEFNLNACTVNMTIFELVDVVMKDLSLFKKRLSDIHENTKLPIILLIEDIETIVNERWVESDGVTQALTTFFEWVGSLPVTVIATTNYPERLPNRLVRPKRLEKIVKFDVPLSKEVILNTLEVHISRNLSVPFEVSWIDKDDFIKKYFSVFKYFTTSHIADFIGKIKDHYEFKREFNPEYVLSYEDIDKIQKGLLIPVDDIRMRQKSIDWWYEEMTIKWREQMWFKPESAENSSFYKREWNIMI